MRYIFYIIIVAIDLYAIFFHTPASKTFQKKAPVMNIDYERSMALSYLNELRQKAGMSAYATSSILSHAAQQHADYLVRHHQSGHYETPAKEGYSGKLPWERAIAAGYKVGMLSENVSVNALDYKDSVDNLFAAIYHRFGFLDFQSDQIGIGVTQDAADTDYNAFVYDMGLQALNEACSNPSYSGSETYAYKICTDPTHRIREARLLEILSAQKIASKPIVVYPYENQQDVPPAFYEESPDPLPDYGVSGFPITIQFNDHYIKNAKVKSISLFDPKGKEVPSRILYSQNDPNHLIKQNNYALMPLERLKYGTTYRVALIYQNEEKKEKKVWSFTTRKLPAPYFVINQKSSSIQIEPHKTYTLYFEPMHRHDILGDLHFPADLNVRFLDQNTVQIRLESDNKDPFDFKSEDKSVHVSVSTP